MKISVAIFGVIFGLLLISSPKAVSQDSSAAFKLEVRVNYTGTGSVDKQHKIYVALWDSPDFVGGGATSMPVEIQSTSSKNGSVTFENVKAPAYASTVFDPTGQWDAQSAPPDGSSLGLYTKAAGKPEPIDSKGGKTKTIELSFDDTVKMRAGAPTR